MEKILPRGVPTISYVRVLNQDQPGQVSDIAIDGDFVSILEPGQPTTRHEVAHVFERGISDQEFCEATIGQEAGASMGAALNPIAAFVEDATSAVILVIGSKFTKKWQFLKRIFLPFAANEFFACLADKEQQGAEVFQYEITLTAFEIQEEIITDLLKPSSRGLSINVSPDDGVSIQALLKQKILSEEGLRQLFIESCENRCTHTQPVGGSIDTSTAVWEITLTQKEADGDVVLSNSSRLLIVDIPSLNPLCNTNTEIRILEGHNLHRSLQTFFDCSQKLASTNLAPLAPFRSSKLTHYLSELLGGNAVVVALGLLHSGEPQVSRKVLEIMSYLTNARFDEIGHLKSDRHYPIAGKEMSELVQGLMMKYRSMLLNAEDMQNIKANDINSKEFIANHPTVTLLNERTKDLEQRLAEAQKQYAELLLNHEQIETDAIRLYEAIELLKAKYSTVLEEKKQLANELIKKEEEKLELARGIVELKIAHSQSCEKAEKELFEATSNMLAMKNEIYEMDGREQLLKVQLAELQDKFDEISSLFERERENGIATKTELHEVRQQLEKAEGRNVEIGAELVTLLNTKSSLEDQVSFLRKQCADLEESLHADTSDITALRSENSQLEAKLNDLEKESEALERELAETRLELEKLRIEGERNRLQFEQSAGDYLREKDQSLKRETQAVIAEVNHLQHEKEQLLVCVRREERRRRDALRDLDRISEEKETAEKILEETRGELWHLKEAYRKHLGNILEGESPQTLPLTARSGTQENSDMTWQAMSESYILTERKLMSELEIANNSQRQTTTAIRRLYDYYRAALDIIEDHCPHALPTEIVDSESILFQQVDSSDPKHSTSLLSDALGNQKEQNLAAKLQEAESNLLAEQERTASVIAKYRKSLQRAESELEKKNSEISLLNERLEFLTSRMNDKKLGNDEANEKIESVSRRLEAQMQELRKKEGQNPETRKQITALKAQCSLLEEENREMRALLLKGVGKKASDGVESLEAYIKQLEHDSDGAILQQLREVEARNASLIARNSGLDEELRSYKLYMRETIVQYKRQIQDLQHQLASFHAADIDLTSREKKSLVPVPPDRPRVGAMFPEIPRIRTQN